LADRLVVAEERHADVVLLEVEDHAGHGLAAMPAELHQLSRHRARQAVDAGDPVAAAEDGAGLEHRDLLIEVLDLLADDAADLFGLDLHRCPFPPYSARNRSRICSSCVRMLPSYTVSPTLATMPPMSPASVFLSRRICLPDSFSSEALTFLT